MTYHRHVRNPKRSLRRVFNFFFSFPLFDALSLSLLLCLSYPNCHIFLNGVFVYQVTMLQLGEHNINSLKTFSQFCSQYKLHCCAHFFCISPNGLRSVRYTAVWRIVANWVKSSLSLEDQTLYSVYIHSSSLLNHANSMAIWRQFMVKYA